MTSLLRERFPDWREVAREAQRLPSQEDGMTDAKRGSALAWREGLPVWLAIHDDICAELGLRTISEILNDMYGRRDAIFGPLFRKGSP